MKKNVKMTGLILAIGAASMFTMAPVVADTHHHHGKVECYGVNSCKGKGSCKSSSSSCKGKNSCKGKGMKWMNEKKCKKMGGKVMDQDQHNSSGQDQGTEHHD